MTGPRDSGTLVVMLRIALASVVSVVVSCAGIRPGLSNDSGGNAAFEGDGCDDDRGRLCGGAGYDDLAVAGVLVAVAGVLIPKLYYKLR